MISVEEALEIVLRETRLVESEEILLEDAPGRVLSRDVRSDIDMPPFDRAAMDGYAVRAADVGSVPATLTVTGEVVAGGWPDGEVGPGEAVRIMTGPRPRRSHRRAAGGEDTGARKRWAGGDPRRPRGGRARGPRGSEARQGQVVLEAGCVIGPAAVAVLASTGHARVPVSRRPRVAVLVTGDEIVDPATVPGAGQIRNSNGPAVAAQARLSGAEVRSIGVAPDRREETVAAVRGGLSPETDVLVVSGGVSAGDYDLVEPALQELGVELLFTSVAIKPGAPLVFGKRATPWCSGSPAPGLRPGHVRDLRARGAHEDAGGPERLPPVGRGRASRSAEEPVGTKSPRSRPCPLRERAACGPPGPFDGVRRSGRSRTGQRPRGARCRENEDRGRRDGSGASARRFHGGRRCPNQNAVRVG